MLTIIWPLWDVNRPEYVIETLAKKYGHSIIFLPPYHPELNPIELCWATVKNYIAKNNKSFNLTDIIKNLIPVAFSKIG